MKTIILTTMLVTATIYHADPKQCNADYLTTASLKKINSQSPGSHRWIAVSRDLEPLGFVFGAKVCVEGAGDMDGIWTVEDRMNKRWKNRIDFLVDYDIKGGKWNNVKISLVNELD
jgi:3D (Asp-Asp-Asp) domain-containing protein